MNRREVKHSMLRLMRYAALAQDARLWEPPEVYWDLRTSTDDCRIAIRAAAGEPLELPHDGRRHE